MFGKKKKKKLGPQDKIAELYANDELIKAINLKVTADEDGGGHCEIMLAKPEEKLHYDESDLKIITFERRKIIMKVRFVGARQEKKFYIYRFDILDYSEEF